VLAVLLGGCGVATPGTPALDAGVDASAEDCACVSGPAGAVGVVMGAGESCPVGPGLLLGSGLSAPDCAGCTCARAPTACRGTLYAWQIGKFEECLADPPGTGGLGEEIETDQACFTIYAEDMTLDFPSGFRLGPLSIKYGVCAPTGTPAAPPAVFAEQLRFCPVAVRPSCLLLEGGAACPAGTVRRGGDWFEGIEDQRRCGACTCGAPEGGSCAGVHAQIGNDVECDRPNQIELEPEKKVCLQGLAAPYAPGVILAGQPAKGRCAAATETSGAAHGTGAHVLCCAR
jgi:hypothetical protein